MTALNKQELREAAENATAGQWVVELGDEVYAVDGDDSEQIAMVFSDNGRSDAAFIAVASPVAVLSLLDENLQLQRDKDSLEAVAVAMRDDMRDAREKLEAAEKRNAELEARKFKVEMPESFYPDGDIDAPLVVDELEVIAAIVEAGGKPVAFCKRCDREIDLTHRPDGSHYCHAPVAGIGVKGE